MKRSYVSLINEHLKNYHQMVFIGGPRQVGKTTLSRMLEVSSPPYYLNWDIDSDRAQLLGPQRALLDNVLSDRKLEAPAPLIILDELHKYKDWKNYLKGLYDLSREKVKVVLTGSAQLDIYKKGGDSLMGRYFSYTIHPFSVREVLSFPDDQGEPSLISSPSPIPSDTFEALWRFGGFPDPFLKQEDRFYKRWVALRKEQLCRQDIADVHLIQDMAQFELLVYLLSSYAGNIINPMSLAKHVRVSHTTIRRWLQILKMFYYCFELKPWSTNIPRSLLKDPKMYLWDWSLVEDKGARFENMVASHLKKAVDFWNEAGLGVYGLYFIRTKEKKEVDFLVVANNKPLFLVEAKYKAQQLSPTLREFHQKLGTDHAFQVVYDMPYVDRSCFEEKDPIIVPAKTFLSQLV